MRLLLTCYCNGDGEHGDDGDTIFVSCGAYGPFGIEDGKVSEYLGQQVAVQSVSLLPEDPAYQYYAHPGEEYAVALDHPPEGAEAEDTIPHIDLTAALDPTLSPMRDEGDALADGFGENGS